MTAVGWVADWVVAVAILSFTAAIATSAWLAGARDAILIGAATMGAAVGVVAAAVSRLAGLIPSRLSSVASLLGAAGVAVLSWRTPTASLADDGLAALVIIAALNNLRPHDSRTDQGPAELAARPATAAAGIATVAALLAAARMLAEAVPGIGLVTTAVAVLLAALVVRAIPDPHRTGAQWGIGVVGLGVGMVTAAVAVGEAGRVLAAATPWWAADLTGWSQRVQAWAPYGAQVPASLIVGAIAAVTLLERSIRVEASLLCVGLAGLAAPAALSLPWWSPLPIVAGQVAVAGMTAAFATSEATARRRVAVAGGLIGC